MSHPDAADPAPEGHQRRPAHPIPLVAAKLTVPAIPPILVERAHLYTRLTAACAGELTAITGPAGSGKTVLVSSWVRAGLAPGPVAWLTLDPHDDRPHTFWPYLLEAIRVRLPELAGIVGDPTRGRLLDRQLLSPLATYLSGLTRPLILVVDRAEVITDRGVIADLDRLLRYSTPGLRLVAVGRQVRLPLPRYQLTGQLTVIGRDDLALRTHETADILARYGVRLPDQETAALHARTEGWVTAVCLRAMALRQGDASAPDTVGDFLRADVLDTQPSRVQDTLLRTSILDDVDPTLAAHLTGWQDAGAILDELVRAHAFVQPAGTGRYRYHPLFRDALRQRLTARHPFLVRGLHRSAARWYADHDSPLAAVRHAAEAGDWALATEVAVHDVGISQLTSPRGDGVRALFTRLPDNQPGAPAALVRAILALARSDHETARGQLDLSRASRDQAPTARARALRLAVAAVGVVLARLTGDVVRAIHEAAEAELVVALMPPDAAELPRIRALVRSNLGAAQLWAGQLDDARASLTRAATDPDGEWARYDALGQLALIELRAGRLHQAEKYAREALAVADRAGVVPQARVGAASAALAAVALLWNDLPGVREHIADALAARGGRLDPSTATAIALLRARIACAHKDGERALAAVEYARAGVYRWHGASDTRAEVEITAADVHLSLGDTASARACVQALADSPERTLALARIQAAEGDPRTARLLLVNLSARCLATSVRVPTLQDAALLRARLATADGDTPAAEHALREALDLGRPDQRRRPFADAGPWLRQMLHQRPDLTAAHPWLSRRLGPPLPEDSTVVIELLTDREREVLNGLTQGLSTEDIGRDLWVSVNTVKTHLKSIYRKLGTNSRSATARRARELNLVGNAGLPHER